MPTEPSAPYSLNHARRDWADRAASESSFSTSSRVPSTVKTSPFTSLISAWATGANARRLGPAGRAGDRYSTRQRGGVIASSRSPWLPRSCESDASASRAAGRVARSASHWPRSRSCSPQSECLVALLACRRTLLWGRDCWPQGQLKPSLLAESRSGKRAAVELLPQPGGFEGFGIAEVVPRPNHASIFQLVDMARRSRPGAITPPAPPPCRRWRRRASRPPASSRRGPGTRA